MPAPFDLRPDLRPHVAPFLSSPINRGSGTTAQRPVLGNGDQGFFNDTSIGKRIYWSGTRWYDQFGTPSLNFGA